MAHLGHISGPGRATAAIDHPKPRCRHWQASCAR